MSSVDETKTADDIRGFTQGRSADFLSFYYSGPPAHPQRHPASSAAGAACVLGPCPFPPMSPVVHLENMYSTGTAAHRGWMSRGRTNSPLVPSASGTSSGLRPR